MSRETEGYTPADPHPDFLVADHGVGAFSDPVDCVAGPTRAISTSLEPGSFRRAPRRRFSPRVGGAFNLLCSDPTNPASCMTFAQLLGNSLPWRWDRRRGGAPGATAAMPSRFRFIGRQVDDRLYRAVMLPASATVGALYVLLSQIKFGDETLRTTLLGLSLAYASGTLPFAIWNLKGYFDTVPRELEEAAKIDGASASQTFFLIMLPLSLPALAVTVLLRLCRVDRVRPGVDSPGRPIAVHAGHGVALDAGSLLPSDSAMSILMSRDHPFFFLAQRYIVSGLTAGSVK